MSLWQKIKVLFSSILIFLKIRNKNDELRNAPVVSIENNSSAVFDTHSSAASSSEKVDGLLGALELLRKSTEEKLKELNEKTTKFDDEVKKISDLKNKANKAVSESGKALNIAYLGFFVLVFVAVGLVFGYWMYIHDSTQKDDYKYHFSEKLIQNEYELKILKNCLKTNKWLNPKCLD